MKETLQAAELKMKKTIERLQQDLGAIRAGRANPAVLDKIKVDYYGTPTAINQMAAISVAEARILVIQPWDRSTLKDIEKAINKADIGITPNNDGTVIRLAFPPLTEERRKDLCKEIHKMAEEGKVAVRALRRELNEKLKAMKKASTISEDEEKDGEKRAQTLTDRYCTSIDDIAKTKEAEIMEI